MSLLDSFKKTAQKFLEIDEINEKLNSPDFPSIDEIENFADLYTKLNGIYDYVINNNQELNNKYEEMSQELERLRVLVEGGSTEEQPLTPFIPPAPYRAFPKALGAAMFARNNEATYTIAEVTNLNATGAGSFWDALGDNTIVVFKVSGIVNIPITQTRSFSNCIVLGQTAPQGGITVVGNGWRWDGCQNVIFRYVKFRTWQSQSDINNPSGVDAIDITGNSNENNNIIFDHCSFAFGGDETLSFRGDTHTVTVQNCIFSYGKTGMLSGDSDDTTRGYDFSILNNFWHTVGKRTPNPNSNGRIDIIGNVTYNILNQLMRTGGSSQLNEIGNNYTGGATHKLSLLNGYLPKIFTSNNRHGSSQNPVTANGQDNTAFWTNWLTGRDPEPSDFVSEAFPLLNYDIDLPDGDDALLQVQNRNLGCKGYLDNTGYLTTEFDDLDISAYDEFDNSLAFDWTNGESSNRSQGNWKFIPQRQWLLDNQASMGVIQNTHDSLTHTGVVPNVWITSRGLDPVTFDPLGNDLHETYTNVEIYSFNVDI
ncbi:MAG: hypothetical protein ACWA5P_01930 [bacterium]